MLFAVDVGSDVDGDEWEGAAVEYLAFVVGVYGLLCGADWVAFVEDVEEEEGKGTGGLDEV